MNKAYMQTLLAVAICLLTSTTVVSAEHAHVEKPSGTRIYKLWDNVPARDWTSQAYKLGNGYMGATVFGGTDTERIQVTEKTLYNTGGGKSERANVWIQNHGSMTNFAEINLVIDHAKPVNYERCLNLNEAIHYVRYEHDSVKYSREYFMSYPDNVMVVKLSADQSGKVSFTLRPEIPYRRSAGRPHARTGEVIAQNDLVRLHGTIKAFSLNYEAQIKVLSDGGTLSSNQDGEITVSGADSVVLVLATGTNYELSEKVFLTPDKSKKLNVRAYPHQKVSDRIARAAKKGFETLRSNHLADYQSLFSRVTLNLSTEVAHVPTKTLLSQYASGEGRQYLEELFAQYGRYLLIASSRKGTLPVGIFGIWRQSEVSQFSAGYWHNANLQANYWGAMSANLAETFIPYSEYWQAYYPAARRVASNHLNRYRDLRDAASSDPDGNGWTIGTGATVYYVGGSGAHSGPGTGGLTSKMLWDYWDFTRDKNYLKNVAYPCLLGLSKFNSKTLRPDPRNPEVLLVSGFSASPEIQVSRGGRKVNANTQATGIIGCTFDQGLAWENHNDTLKAAEILGDNDPFLKTIKEEIGRLDPILIGSDGQVKEFREEDGYSDIGFDPRHRHIAHLHTLHPGTLINSITPQWLKAADKTLDFRGNDTDLRRGPGKAGNGFMGWSTSCRVNMRARTKNGAMAYEAFSKWLKRNRQRENLRDGTLDGNLGLMSGVVEMLIQSHEGCIEPLPALPYEWRTGSFGGLMARGNFDVSAKWNGKRVRLELVSKSGGLCRVKYPGIETTQISDEQGNRVSCANGQDHLVEFMTTRNKRYLMEFDQAAIQKP